MRRDEYAEALMMDVHGFDAAHEDMTMEQFDSDSQFGDETFGADDPVKAAGLSTIPIQLTIANAAALSLDLMKIDDLAAAALPTGVASPAIAAYRNLIAYVQANPCQLQSIVIGSSESATGGAPVLQSLRISPKRVTPFGANFANEVRAQSYQTTQDFQANRATIPLSVGLDGFTFLNMVTDTNNSGATVTLNVTLMVGRRADGRKQLRKAPAMAMRPGGRGPVPAGR